MADSIRSYSRPTLFSVSLREIILWQSLAENKLYCFLECSHRRRTQISLKPISEYLWYEIEDMNKWEMSNLSCSYHLQKFVISCYNEQRHPGVGLHIVSIWCAISLSKSINLFSFTGNFLIIYFQDVSWKELCNLIQI